MTKYLTPLKSIRAKCLDCSCFQPKEVTLCPMTDCSLYAFRNGRNVKRKGMYGHPGELAQKSHSVPIDFVKDEVLNDKSQNANDGRIQP